jgi:hypothetical protein
MVRRPKSVPFPAGSWLGSPATPGSFRAKLVAYVAHQLPRCIVLGSLQRRRGSLDLCDGTTKLIARQLPPQRTIREQSGPVCVAVWRLWSTDPITDGIANQDLQLRGAFLRSGAGIIALRFGGALGSAEHAGKQRQPPARRGARRNLNEPRR